MLGVRQEPTCRIPSKTGASASSPTLPGWVYKSNGPIDSESYTFRCKHGPLWRSISSLHGEPCPERTKNESLAVAQARNPIPKKTLRFGFERWLQRGQQKKHYKYWREPLDLRNRDVHRSKSFHTGPETRNSPRPEEPLRYHTARLSTWPPLCGCPRKGARLLGLGGQQSEAPHIS